MTEAPEITSAIMALVNQLPEPDKAFGGTRWSAHDLIEAIIDRAGGAYGTMLYAEDMIERVCEHAQNDEEDTSKAFMKLSDEEQFDVACEVTQAVSGDDSFWSWVIEEVHDKSILTLAEIMEKRNGK